MNFLEKIAGLPSKESSTTTARTSPHWAPHSSDSWPWSRPGPSETSRTSQPSRFPWQPDWPCTIATWLRCPSSTGLQLGKGQPRNSRRWPRTLDLPSDTKAKDRAKDALWPGRFTHSGGLVEQYTEQGDAGQHYEEEQLVANFLHCVDEGEDVVVVLDAVPQSLLVGLLIWRDWNVPGKRQSLSLWLHQTWIEIHRCSVIAPAFSPLKNEPGSLTLEHSAESRTADSCGLPLQTPLCLSQL